MECIKLLDVGLPTTIYQIWLFLFISKKENNIIFLTNTNSSEILENKLLRPVGLLLQLDLVAWFARDRCMQPGRLGHRDTQASISLPQTTSL